MTPEYASPEQIRGEPVTTVSDVYLLGLILYRLLTGRYPYALKGRLVWEIERIICSEDPPKPSAAVIDSDKNAAHHGITSNPSVNTAGPEIRPRSLSRQLRGDLDNIVLKAISREPWRRYSSAEALSEDLRRYLDREPVTAHPPTVGYRAAKFLRRYKTLVVATGLLLLSLTGGIIATLQQARRAKRERERAESSLLRANRERARADSEAATARAVNDFLQNDLLAQASATVQARPDIKPDPDLKVRTALDRAAARIAGQFDALPLVEASIRQTIGDTYVDLGLYSEAQGQLERALDLRHRVLGDEHRDTLTSMHKLGLLEWYQGKYADAEPLLTKVLEVRRHALGEDHPDTASVMNDLALVDWYRGKYALAEPLFTKALEIRRRALGQEHPETLSTINNLAGLYVHQGKYADAEPLLTKVLEVRRRLLGQEHPNTLLSMNNLAVILWDEGEYAPAETLFTNVLEVKRRVLGQEHPRRLASMMDLGLQYVYQGKYASAEPLLAKALEVRRRILGPEHPDTLLSLNNLTVLYVYEGKYETAESIYIKLLELQRRVLGQEHPRRLASMMDLGALYIKTRKYAAAEPLLREALNSHAKSSTNTWVRYNCQSLLGASLAGQRKYAEAEPLLLSGYQGMLQREATIPWERRPALNYGAEWILELYESWGKPEKAGEWREKLQMKAANHLTSDNGGTEQP